MELTPFHHFVDFVQCNDQVAACQQLQVRLESDLLQLEKEHALHVEQLERARTAARAVRKDIDARELELAALRQKKSLAEAKIERVSNPKEYASLQSEVAQATATIERLEEAVMGLWQVLEQADGAAKDAEEVHAQQNVLYAQRQQQLRGTLDVVRAQAVKLQEECVLKGNLVRVEWLEKFRALKKQLPNPVVTLESGACMGCFYRLPAQAVMRLERHELVPCPMCRRILYLV